MTLRHSSGDTPHHAAVAPFRRIVITGGAGFLGSHLCTELSRHGATVTVIDNFLTGSATNLAHLDGDAGVELLCQDVTEPFDVPGRVDLMLHFASPASPVDYLRLPIQTLLAGAAGTRNGLELARRKGCRFVLASTSEVYGDPQVHPQPESYWGHVNPIGPRSVYDEAKRYAEALTVAYRDQYRLDTGIARIFNTYGPRMRPYDGRAIPTFLRQAIAGEPLTVAGDGSQTRSVCYVDDLVEGVLALAVSGEPGPINIGNPHEISVLQLARDVIDAVGSSSQIVHVPRPVDDPYLRRPDVSKAYALLGWQPRIDWAEGLRHTLAWFRDPAAPREAAVASLPVGAGPLQSRGEGLMTREDSW